MKLHLIMRTNVYTLTSTHSIQDAIDLMEQKSIRHIPIIDHDDNVIGIISDRDIRDVRPSILTQKTDESVFLKPISSIMASPVLTAHEDDDVQETAKLFYQHRIGCLPITANGRIIGIISESDILYSLTALLGADRPTSVIEVCVQNYPGMLADVATIFKQAGVNIVSAVAYPSQKVNYHMLSFRVQTIDPRKVIQKLADSGYDVYGPSLPSIGGER
ncbi:MULTISPECIES: acetoin utilization AcuB family protein [Shouchella]|uniref:Acetoin utilization AcuB family protein n=2 Tax=Shouchella TaxID=2893057 RepID=A0ABY7W9L0_9BACI|nr:MULTISPECIES: acetoin utilization AcuB family protein [Shouchella]MED4129965.1 acetoin utilization AcuB family protein [Shouchella miscanthi]WDF04243.1 acetoin utilization AcuB family protein [Shouchella hunanensis]GAF21240.1 CBS domain protein AcuB [Bacillus sp. JCM 19047]